MERKMEKKQNQNVLDRESERLIREHGEELQLDIGEETS